MRRLGVSLVCAGAAVVLGLVALQDAIIYHPRKYAAHGKHYAQSKARFSQSTGQQIETLSYQVGDSDSAAHHTSYYIPPTTAHSDDDVWVVFGGNAQLALDWLDFVATVRSREKRLDSHAFLLFEYPGYDGNPGSLNDTSAARSVLAAVQQQMLAKKKQTDGAGGGGGGGQVRIHLLAHSIGCAVALNYAASSAGGVSSLVLVSPFTSIPDMAVDIFLPSLIKSQDGGGGYAHSLLRHLIKPENTWDNLDQLQRLSSSSSLVKLAVIHGDRDNIVPVEQGRQVHAKASTLFPPPSLRYHEVPRGDHNSITYVASRAILDHMVWAASAAAH